MTQGADLKQFEGFQGRVLQTALVLWTAALATSLIVYRAYSPVVGGILLGGAASLAAYRYRVWTLRRFARRPTAKEASRLPILGAGRYVILAAALGLAVWLGTRGDSGYLIATAATLFLANLAIVIRAAVEARRT